MGDDLGSDDEYLFEAGLMDSAGGARGTAIVYSDNEDGDSASPAGEDSAASLRQSAPPPSKKRRGGAGATEATGAAAPAQEPPPPPSQKRPKKGGSKNLLIQAGRGIALDSAASQAAFLSTIYAHVLKLSPEATAAAFDFRPHLFAPPDATNEKTRKFSHSNLAAFVKSGPLPSMKRLKNWKQPRCPMVLVVTLSARRSVELTKELSALKMPVAKLFAKHLSVAEQAAALRGVAGGGGGGGSEGGGGGRKGKARGRCYSLAVGTPGRLLKLLRHNEEGDAPGSGGALRLTHAELIVLDCHEDSKGWTVCTLKDTAKELMELLRDGVVPELDRRRGKIKVALF